MINLLVTNRETDIAICKMIEKLSENKDFNIYFATPFAKTGSKIYGNCTVLETPSIKSKFDWGVIRSLHHSIKKYKIDLIFSASSSGLSNALFASWGTGAKNIAYRGTQAKVKRLDFTYYLGILNPKVEHVVCETPDILEYLSHYISPKKLSVSVKPFDIKWIDEAMKHPQKADGIPDDASKLIYVGATKGRPYKGLTVLLNAFILVDDPNTHLTIIGEYGESDYLLARQSKLHDNIHFLGYRSDATSFLPDSDLFVLPSLRDASPRVVREAMACGIPCIVTDIPGARDLIINKETGILVPPSSPQKMADAIKALFSNRKQLSEMGVAARNHIIRNFGVDSYTSFFENLFKKLK